MSVHKEIKKVTTHTLQVMKAAGEKISMITAYDYSFAKIFDAAGIDIILVGDSASNVMAGHETTLPITLDQMIYHAQSVVRGINRCLVVVDMPFGSYQSNSEIALASAIKIMKEAGGHSVKLEGGEEAVGGACMEARVVLGYIHSTLRVVESMQAGDILYFKKPEFAVLEANEIPAFDVHVGTLGAQVAVQVERAVVPGKS